MGIQLLDLTFNFSSGTHSLFPNILTWEGQDVADELFPVTRKQIRIGCYKTDKKR